MIALIIHVCHDAHLTQQLRKFIDTKNNLSEKKLVEQLDTPEQLSPSFVAAWDCSIDRQLLEQELEYLWDDTDDTGKTYEIYLGKISRTPIVKSKDPDLFIQRHSDSNS